MGYVTPDAVILVTGASGAIGFDERLTVRASRSRRSAGRSGR
jgi:hypothetical protein